MNMTGKKGTEPTKSSGRMNFPGSNSMRARCIAQFAENILKWQVEWPVVSSQVYNCASIEHQLEMQCDLKDSIIMDRLKRPRYAAVYFAEEQQASIIPSCKLRGWELEDQQTVTVVWDGAECPAKIIKLLDDLAALEETDDRFVEQHVTPADDEITVVTPDDDITVVTPDNDITNAVKESDFNHSMRSIGIKSNVVKLSRSAIHHVDIPPTFTIVKYLCVKPTEVPPSTNKVNTALSSVSKESVPSRTTLPVTVPSTTTLPVTSKLQSSVPSTSNEPLQLICTHPVRSMPSTFPESPLYSTIPESPLNLTIPESPLSTTIIQEGIDRSANIDSFEKLMPRSFCETMEDLVSLDNNTTRLVLSEIENDCFNNSPSPQSKLENWYDKTPTTDTSQNRENDAKSNLKAYIGSLIKSEFSFGYFDSCPFGDQSTGIAAHGLTCAQIKHPEHHWRCYDDHTRKKCCETCQSILRNDQGTRCEYGDKSDWCLTNIASQNDKQMCYWGHNADLCCGSCSKYANMAHHGCEYGDKQSGCDASRCSHYSSSHRGKCCETCLSAPVIG
ncbi:unnamed protein product [Mytilus coruscus]|uniref:Uncharacterized protein n=1 Tax=Mytilus coruscus TaxID=42192 RepID=A0A6J8DA75_MYTCO|nr:unnamed protein product [Mytilus coruscus]